MFSFEYYTPTRVVFGKKTEEKTGKLVKEFGGRKVLIHYGGGSALRSGLMDRIKASLDAEGISYVLLGGAVPNPRLSLVYEGIALCRREQVDFLLAVGGGSAIDSAKAIGYGVANEGDVWDFYAGERKARACLPIGVVLTLSATGSEMSNSSVITKEEGLLKRGYSSDLARPRFAVLNPELTMTLPDYQTACGCTDIMMHTMERYFTNGGNMELTDQLAEGLLRTVMHNAGILLKEPDNYDARAEVMWAGSLSHNGLTGCGSDGGDWIPHKLEHELSGMFDVAHGAGLAAVWGSWARYVCADCLPRFEKFAVSVMGIPPEGSTDEIALKGIEAMENFFREIHMPTNLRELGISPTQEELREMARKCAEGVGGAKGSAKLLHENDMLEILKMASLPSFFTFADGRPVLTKCDQKERKEEIRRLYETEIYGAYQSGEEVSWNLNNTTAGDLKELSLEISVSFKGRQGSFPCRVFLPDRSSLPKETLHRDGSPVILAMWDFAQKDYVLARDIAVITFLPNTIAADQAGRTGVFYDVHPYTKVPSEQTGTLAAWGWAFSKILDALYGGAAKELGVNPSANLVTGVSRFGKAAFVAGAMDSRIRITVPACSGAGGTALFGYKSTGNLYDYSSIGETDSYSFGQNEPLESLQSMDERHWFNDRFLQYRSEEDLPVEQHLLSSLYTGEDRYLFITASYLAEDWTNPPAMWKNYLLSREIFRRLGDAEHIYFHIHKQGHAVIDEDVVLLVEYLEHFLYGKTVSTDFSALPNCLFQSSKNI